MSDQPKERFSLTVDRDVAQYLRSKDNISGYINQLLREDMHGEAIDRKLLTMRREMIAGQLDELASRKQSKETELAEIDARLDRQEDAQENLLGKAAETLQTHQLNEGNPAVENWAEKIGMDQDRLIQEIEVRTDDSGTEYYE